MTDSRRKEQIDLFVKAYGIAQERINKGGRSYYRQLVKKYFNYQIN
jgi:NitT/TauT family transport system substrate-binding protein